MYTFVSFARSETPWRHCHSHLSLYLQCLTTVLGMSTIEARQMAVKLVINECICSSTSTRDPGDACYQGWKQNAFRYLHGLPGSGCWRHSCRWGVFQHLGYWATTVLPQSRRQSSAFLLKTGRLRCSPTPNICLWYLVCGQVQLFAIDEANARKAIKWNQKHQFCDSTGQRRGTQKVEGGRHLGAQRVWTCMWVLRKVNTRNQLSNQFPETGVKMMLPHSLLFFHWQAVCFSFVQESKIPIRWWNRTQK